MLNFRTSLQKEVQHAAISTSWAIWTNRSIAMIVLLWWLCNPWFYVYSCTLTILADMFMINRVNYKLQFRVLAGVVFLYLGWNMNRFTFSVAHCRESYFHCRNLTMPLQLSRPESSPCSPKANSRLTETQMRKSTFSSFPERFPVREASFQLFSIILNKASYFYCYCIF